MSPLSRAAQFASERHKANHPTWTLRITPHHHPRLHQAIDIVSHDSGGGAGHPCHLVAPSWEPYLDDIEQALVALSEDDFETFCIGEATESEAIADRSSILKTASALLNEWFDSEPDEAEGDSHDR